MKKILTALFLFLTVCLSSTAQVSVVKGETEPFYDKVKAAERGVILNSESSESVSKYVKIMLLRSAYYVKAKRDYASATDDLRSALYFLSKDKSDKYEETKKKFDKYLTQLNYFPSDEDSFELAKNLYYEGKYFASAYEFEELIKKDYELSCSYEFLGDISQKIMQGGRYSVDYYKKSVAANPKNKSAALKLAKMYDNLEETELANAAFGNLARSCDDIEIIDEIIKIYSEKNATDGENSDNLEILGLCYLQLNDFKSATSYFNRALKLSPDDIFLKYSYAILLHKSGQYNEAVKIYNYILSSNPYESQIRASKAQCLVALNKKNEAIKEYQIILAVYPNSLQAQYALYKLIGGAEIDEIVKKFYPLNEKFAPNSDFYKNLGDYALNLNKTADAVVFYKNAILKNPKNASAYVGLYNAYELSANGALALDTVKRAYANLPSNKQINEIYTKINENSVMQKSVLALEFIKKNDYLKAAQIYEQIEPKTVQIYVSMANCYKNLKNYARAKECLEAALKIDVVNSDLYYNMAILYLEQNSPQSAKGCLLKATSLNKSNLKAQKLLNVIYKKEIEQVLNNAYDFYVKKQYAKAQNILTEGAKKYPNSAQIYYYRGLTYEAQNNTTLALSDFRKTVALDRNYNLAYFSLASILDKLGKEKEALELYERFLAGSVTDENLRLQAQKRALELGKKYY